METIATQLPGLVIVGRIIMMDGWRPPFSLSILDLHQAWPDLIEQGKDLQAID